MSQVITSRLASPRAAACASMCAFCEREFDTVVIRERGKRSASHSDSEPQPQPSSSTRSPSRMPARSVVMRSISASAPLRLLTPGA